jgi:hypothetical protein
MKYIVADRWTHIWLESSATGDPIEVKRPCRFVFDRKRVDLVRLDIQIGDKLVRANRDEESDLLDSLVNGNPFLLDDPEAYGLALSGSLPEWCRTKAKPKDPKKRSDDPQLSLDLVK